MAKSELIAVTGLQEGFDKCVLHIRGLFGAVEILSRAKKYSWALPLSILAIEEVTKLTVINEHISDNKPITQEEWFNLTRGGSHKLKLKYRSERDKALVMGFSREYYEEIERVYESVGLKKYPSFEQLQQPNTDESYFMELLDKFKQDCFYLGWKNGWWTFEEGLTNEEQEAVLWLVTLVAKNWMLITIMSNRYPSSIQKDRMKELFKNDPLLKEWRKLQQNFWSNDHYRRLEIGRAIFEKYPR